MKLTIPRYASEYAVGRTRQKAITAFATPEQLLAALESKSDVDDETREAVVAALLREHQERRGELWQRLLALAFEPALHEVRQRLPKKKSDDVDQSVLLAFFGAIASSAMIKTQKPRPAIVAELRRRVFRPERRSKRAVDRDADEFEDGAYDADKEGAAEARARDRASAALRNLDPEMREVLLDTTGADKSLREYVRERHPTLDEKSQGAVYDRLKLSRQRALEIARETKEEDDDGAS